MTIYFYVRKLTFSYAFSRNSMGLFPNEMAWPRKGMQEGIYGGCFCRRNPNEYTFVHIMRTLFCANLPRP